MNTRERFVETLLFGNPDKIPLHPGSPRESTLKMWHQQGLPTGINHYEFLLDTLGIEYDSPGQEISLGVSFKMIPEFEEKILEHRDGHYIVQDWMGAITEISDEFDYTYLRVAKDFVTRKWHRFPVQNRADWQGMKKRFDPNSPGRYPDDFLERCKALENRDYVVSLAFNGPFWQLREWWGLENLCMLMLDDPGFVHEMIAFWTDFVSKTMAPVLERVQVDYVLVNEDMAYKAHSMISPKMTREFLLPAYERWIGELRRAGCSVISIDSDGYVAELIPLWIDAGFDCCFPVEVAAGNDIVEYRRLYGKEMAYIGGIDKRAIAAGGKVMEREVMRVVPPLLEKGGFIPGCDHGVPPDISWGSFLEYTRLLARLTGWL